MIEEIINSIIEKIEPSDGDNLHGFILDCEGLLFDGSYKSLEIIETGEKKNLLDIGIEVKKEISSIQELTKIVTHDYQNIEYQNFSAHGVEWTEKALILRFITVISNDCFYVSGTIRIFGKNYEKLYKKNIKMFKNNSIQIS